MNENVMQKNPMATEEQTRKSPMFTPHVDIRESNEELVILADMPGVDGKSIDIQFEDGALVVHGTVKPRQSPAVRFLRQEYGIGDFERRFRVHESIDASKIDAEYADGVLKVHLPKAEKAKPRKIDVKLS